MEQPFPLPGRDGAAPRLKAYLQWMVNAYWEPLDFKLPPVPDDCDGPWRRWIDTALESPEDACAWRRGIPVAEQHYRVQPRSLVILILPETGKATVPR